MKRRYVHLHGPGRAATSVGLVLARSGYLLASLSGGGEAGSRLAQAAFAREGLHLPWTPKLPPLVEGSLILVGVPDDALARVLEELGQGPLPAGGLVLHLSGCHGLESFPADWPRGVGRGAWHPLRSFAARTPDGPDLGGALVACEARESKVLAELHELAQLAGGRPVALSGEGRALYHCGAALLSNGLVALMEGALSAFEKAGLPPGEALPGLVNLASGTLANLRQRGVAEALTGPVARGDAHIIESHLRLLKEQLPEFLDLYRELLTVQARIVSYGTRFVSPLSETLNQVPPSTVRDISG